MPSMPVTVSTTTTTTTSTSPVVSPAPASSPMSPYSARNPSRSPTTSIASIKEHMHHASKMLEPGDRQEALTTLYPRPIPNSYWATPYLLACEYPWCPASAAKLDALLLAGVRTFIDLTEAGELSPYSSILNARAAAIGIHLEDLGEEEQIEYHRFPIRDRSLPRSISQINSVMRVLNSAQQRNRISAVHCRGGIGRTGLVVGCWLVTCGLACDGDESLRIIAQEWKGVEKHTRFPHSPETGDQEAFVRNWKVGTESSGIMGLGSGLCVTGGVAPFTPNKMITNALTSPCG